MKTRNPWADDPKHCVADWQDEVASGDTRLGYRDWIKNQRMMRRLRDD